MRSLISDDGTITLTARNINDGKGKATLSIDSEANLAEITEIAGQLLGNETSIMITPLSIGDDSEFTGVTQTVSSIFTTSASSKKKSPVVDKIAQTDPNIVREPSEEEESLVIDNITSSSKKINLNLTPAPSPNNKLKPILNMDGLLEAVNIAKDKVVNIDIDSIKNPRLKALAIEQKERMEAIDIPAFIVNEKIGVIAVNDLNITLPMNYPFDLSRVSAKKIFLSKDLKSLYNQGYIKFIHPKDISIYQKKVENSENSKIGSLEIFDNHEKAEQSITDPDFNEEKDKNDYVPLEISENNLDQETDEESMVSSLSSLMSQPLPETSESDAAIIRSSHGNSPKRSQSGGGETLSGAPKLRTISKR